MDKPSERIVDARIKRARERNPIGTISYETLDPDIAAELDRLAADNARVMEYCRASAERDQRVHAGVPGSLEDVLQKAARRFLAPEQGKAEAPTTERPEQAEQFPADVVKVWDAGSGDQFRKLASGSIVFMLHNGKTSPSVWTEKELDEGRTGACSVRRIYTRPSPVGEKSAFTIGDCVAMAVEITQLRAERDALKKEIDCGSNRAICNNPVKRCWACEVAYQKSLRQQSPSREEVEMVARVWAKDNVFCYESAGRTWIVVGPRNDPHRRQEFSTDGSNVHASQSLAQDNLERLLLAFHSRLSEIGGGR